MASQVLSGSSNPSYTNNTGQNVRIVINYMTSSISSTLDRNGNVVSSSNNISVSWAGIAASQSSTTSEFSIGRTLSTSSVLPTEIMLASGQTFSATCSAYNIVVIPEAG